MRSFTALALLLALLGIGSGSLLEMSQMLWSRALSGGYGKIGRVDPLRVPVVKVDQSEGNTSYRVVLRDLQIRGLNDSTIESVHIVRGELKSNLSDGEAGYVSYNEQHDLDSIRYRFHTVVKEPKANQKPEADDGEMNYRSTEKIVEYNPMYVKVREKESFANEEQFRGRYASVQQQQQQQRNGQSKNNEAIYGDMRVSMHEGHKNPASLHLVYTNSNKNAQPQTRDKEATVRPCVGACKPYPYSTGRVEFGDYSTQRTHFSSNENARGQTVVYPNQRYNADGVGEESTTAGYAMRAQLGGANFSAESSNGQRPNQFSFKRGNFGVSYHSANTQEPFETDSVAPVMQVYRVGHKSEDQANQRPIYYAEYPSRPSPAANQYSKQDRVQVKYGTGSRNGYTESTIPPSHEEFVTFKSPLIRLEKQPGYVDIVYSSEKKADAKPKAEKLQAPAEDPRAYGLAEIIKDLRGNQRYIIHNFTEGESLRKRNDAVRVATESKRIKDLIRYAKEYQEKQGYFEEGVELIYHFGDQKNSSASNDTLKRRKRQHVDVKGEDDVMHVVVKIRVPRLSVKSNYALTGKVGEQLLRGNGLLVGNFTDVIADFTVELKKVNNNTMIVRAARAKLTSKDRKIKLQGMDEKGPVEAILAHGLMAAEAVAAMIADDLASKALNEGNADSMIYKMYRNLPAVHRV